MSCTILVQCFVFCWALCFCIPVTFLLALLESTKYYDRPLHALIDCYLVNVLQDKFGGELPSFLSKPSPQQEEFGILGTNGISAGGFLVSPYAVNQSIADIQITLYPAVSVPPKFVHVSRHSMADKSQSDLALDAGSSLCPPIRFHCLLFMLRVPQVSEPHYVALVESKARRTSAGSKNSNNRDGEQSAPAVDFRNQILFTATLLCPDATFQVRVSCGFLAPIIVFYHSSLTSFREHYRDSLLLTFSIWLALFHTCAGGAE